MLNIAKQQLTELGQGAEDSFRAQVTTTLEQHFPVRSNSPEAIRAVVDLAVADGREAGLQGAQALAMYAMLAYLLGLEIKDDPRFIQAVKLSKVTEAEKISWMEGWLDSIATALDH